MRSQRATWQAIADALNAAGMMRRNGTPWTQSAVAGVHGRAVR